jgi:hypothetical protein
MPELPHITGLVERRNDMRHYVFLFASLVTLSFWQPSVDARPPQHTGTAIMTHSSEQSQPDAPEHFNQPELFLAEVKNLDVQNITWLSKTDTFFTQPNGVVVSIWIHNNKELGKTYIEDITHPKSPFSYKSTYDGNGSLLFKRTFFYGSLFNDVCEYKDGKCTPKNLPPYSHGIKPVIPITHTRAVILKETGIDLYDTSTIRKASFLSRDNKHYCYIHTMSSDEILLDAETGKILFQRHIISGHETDASFPGEPMGQESSAYKKSEKMLKKSMKEGEGIYQVYRKVDTKDTERFYEVFVGDSSIHRQSEQQLVSFLLDLKKEKILYQCNASHPFMAPGGLPFVQFLDEYQQYLKMREAEEEKPGPFGWFKGK